MDRESIIREWFYRLPKGYAEPPYSKAEMDTLHEVLAENGMNGSVFVNEDVDPGPKRNFKPYGDKYTEFEKATNHTNKEPIKEVKGNSMYDDILALKRSFGIFKQQSPDLYKQLDAKFKVKNIQKTLGDMQKFMDTPQAYR